jgi:Domain of unknown function (DUF1906)
MSRIRLMFSLAVLFGGAIFLAMLFSIPAPRTVSAASAATTSYLGFDRNVYPGDAGMLIMRKTFAYTSYWLSPPPGEKTNTWRGKREPLRAQGFGFLVLYRGRDSGEFKKAADGPVKSASDAAAAIASAKAEGFPHGTVIFLDIEEGGRLPAVYHAYLLAWTRAIIKAGFHPGVYCSGMPAKEEPGVTITTADDIRSHPATSDIAIWADNDACPPAPGCTFPENPPPPSASGIAAAIVWQFAQSPRRKELSARCATTYYKDGNCYTPGDTSHAWFLDVNSATSADPSNGR